MKRAFTLVELLIVISIIGILGAVLFPLFSKARDNARRSSCQSNLKQLGLGVMQYCRDYDEKFPLAYIDQDGINGYSATGDKGWSENLWPYVKSNSIWMCPSAINAPGSGPMRSSYWLSAPMDGIRMATINRPAQSVLMGDCDYSPPAIVATHGAIAYSGDAPSLKYNRDIWDITEKTEGKGGRRHLRGINFLFGDGHVKWLNPTVVGAAPIDDGEPTFRIN